MTTAPKRRGGSYRDPTLSDRWLREAELRADREFGGDAGKIIRRLVQEVRAINEETGR